MLIIGYVDIYLYQTPTLFFHDEGAREMTLARGLRFLACMSIIVSTLLYSFPVASAHTMTYRGIRTYSMCLNPGQSYPFATLYSFSTHANVVTEVSIWLYGGDVFQYAYYEFSMADAGVEAAFVSEDRYNWGSPYSGVGGIISWSMDAHFATTFSVRFYIINDDSAAQCCEFQESEWSYTVQP